MKALGTLRRVTIKQVHTDGFLLLIDRRGEPWILGPSLTAMLRTAHPGEQWLIRWHQPKDRGAEITEARRVG